MDTAKQNNAIASERTRLGWSQTDLGGKVGKDRKTIARWEADPTSMPIRCLLQLAKLFNCSTDYLLGLTDERVPYAKSAA